MNDNNDLEDLLYQFRPFFYLTAAPICYKYSVTSSPLLLAAGLFAAAGLYILFERYNYRYRQ